MMLAWSFATPTVDEVGRLLRGLGKHRYVRETDHRLHWTVDRALASLPTFAERASRFEAAWSGRTSELTSRDPDLWTPASVDVVIEALTAFWSPGEAAANHARRLAEIFGKAGFPMPDHPPFEPPEDDPPFPELVLLDWILLPVEELDSERHEGALQAMVLASEVPPPSEPVYQEGPTISLRELSDGAPDGQLVEDFVIWSDGPYSYSDYVLRGVAKVAKLREPPVGYHDL